MTMYPSKTNFKVEKTAGYQEQESPSILAYSRQDVHRPTSSKASTTSLPPESLVSSLPPNDGRYAPKNWGNPSLVDPSNFEGKVSTTIEQKRSTTSVPVKGGISQTVDTTSKIEKNVDRKQEVPPEANASSNYTASLSPAVLHEGRFAPKNWQNPNQVDASEVEGKITETMRQTRSMTSFPATGGISRASPTTEEAETSSLPADAPLIP